MAPGNDVQESSKFCLKWDGFHNNLTSVFESLRQGEELVDITLCCEGRKLKAHKMMLSAASPFFRDLLQENPCQHPVFVLRDTRCDDMVAILQFVYRGSVNVSQNHLASFIQTAELLQIRGLSGDEDGKQKESRPPSADPAPADVVASGPARPPGSPATPPQRYRAAATPPTKRRRLSTTPPPVMVTPSEPPAPLAGLPEAVVKQEKVEEADDVVVYDSRVQPGLEQMVFTQQQYTPRAASTSAPNVTSTPSAAANSSEDHSQGAAGGAARGGHVCPVCGQKYWSLASLHNHISLHRGNTVCLVCGQTCSTTSNRNRHMATKHGVQVGWRNGGAGAALALAGGAASGEGVAVVAPAAAGFTASDSDQGVGRASGMSEALSRE